MKHLMYYKESSQFLISDDEFEKIKSEISSLKYILDEDGYISVRICKTNVYVIRVYFQVPTSKCTEPAKGSVTSWIRYLNDDDNFTEFIYRISEILEDLGFEIFDVGEKPFSKWKKIDGKFEMISNIIEIKKKGCPKIGIQPHNPWVNGPTTHTI